MRGHPIIIALATALTLPGCSVTTRIADVFREDPARSILVVVEDQIRAARSSFFALDRAAIEECKQQIESTLDDLGCERERCSDEACTIWRVQIDPRLSAAYNIAVTAERQDEGGAISLAVGLAYQAKREIEYLADIDADRQEMWGSMADAIESVLIETAKEAKR